MRQPGEKHPVTNRTRPTQQRSEVKSQPEHSDGQVASLPSPELLGHFDASLEGLTQAEAQRRLTQYGYNELVEKRVSSLHKFLSYFWGPIPWMIEVAVVLSAVVSHWADLIIIFNFYPVTPIMIVLLALLNDGAILSIAYDNARYSNKPEAWNMTVVLGIATVLGLAGVLESFGLLYLAERVFLLDQAAIPSLIYLKLSVAGHLTVFVTRTRGPFWSLRPSGILLGAVSGTQLLATLITVYGLFMVPIGWGWALVVWGYALAFFLVEDRVKLAAYRVFNHHEKGLLTSRTGTGESAQ